MRRPDEKSTTHPSPGSAGDDHSDKPNAFASALFDELRRA